MWLVWLVGVGVGGLVNGYMSHVAPVVGENFFSV